MVRQSPAVSATAGPPDSENWPAHASVIDEVENHPPQPEPPRSVTANVVVQVSNVDNEVHHLIAIAVQMVGEAIDGAGHSRGSHLEDLLTHEMGRG